MHNINNEYRPIADIVFDLKREFKMMGMNQSEIASMKEIGVNQGHISRIFSGKSGGVTPSIIKLCNYASVGMYRSDEYFDPIQDESLVNTIRNAVRNSPQRAYRLERLIKVAMEVE